MALPIDPTILTRGADWNVGSDDSADAATGAAPTGGAGFGSFLNNKIGELSKLQDDAAGGAQALASGTATDPSSVVMTVEKARLSMQLASQIRTKAIEAVNDVFHTQV
jgi:flagellar hook-basal body complex protein FliE